MIGIGKDCDCDWKDCWFWFF